ncbi:ribonuclease HII [Thermofilum pendens]|uniref:Ribonuclease HII n=1 Tax=Thermofilum pendens (strain DSM 2475 / Hrk 5) TaxID=368408 RepID=RNH2_THEPD|nr:ribonuclease HII [Thermofilum pendens]A1RYM0.1 RecName: Full=Ribonuclease HII; Short=RNase HII [Thermofilum pendens Hrk 5]ABL78300.1 RNase HII [Thermofilum pendens Hrk 5]
MGRVAGIDEAGRGPMLGPMVVAIVVCPEEKVPLLRNMGVRDSKALSPRRRLLLSRAIPSVGCSVKVRVVEPQEIDCAVRGECYENLNHLEAAVFAQLINEVLSEGELEVVYMDSPDPVPSRFEERVRALLKGQVRIVAENGADEKYTIVGAASIVAKETRDEIINALKKTYGDFGSGYPSDPRTLRFAEEWVRKHGEPPPIARKEWATWKRLR